MGTDRERLDTVQRPGGGRNQQSTFAIIVSLTVHLLLLVVLYQQRLAYLANAPRPPELLANTPHAKRSTDAGYVIELDASLLERAEIHETIATDQPVLEIRELRRWEAAPAALTPKLAEISRRIVAGATLPDATTTNAAPPVDAAEWAVRSAGEAATLSAAAGLPQSRQHWSPSEQRLRIVHNSTPPRSRRRVEAAAVAEVPSSFEGNAVSTAADATNSIDSVATIPLGEVGPASIGLARTLPYGLGDAAATGGERRRHSRASLPAAPIVAQLPGLVRRPAPAFARRGHRAAAEFSRCRPSAEMEGAIELGLQYLARIQLDDGRWKFQYLGEDADSREVERVIIHADAAATGLALLALLGAGHDHFGSRYEHDVQAGLDYLRRIQSSSGELFPEQVLPTSQAARFYGHGIATLALCEAYGMTGDPELRQPAQAALDFLAATQHPEFGGWRYVPGTNTDLSVSGWQLLALKHGELAGLAVGGDTFGRLRTLVEQCREPDGERAKFCYNPWASPTDPLTRHGRQPSTVMTSVGMLMHLYLAGDPSDERLRTGADHLLANLPQLGDVDTTAPTGTLGNPRRDTYYWYYATQAMYRMGGDHWQAWSDRLHPLLVSSQTTMGPLAGSWDPHRPVPDKWADYGGRLFVTAMNLLSLEIYDRHLPLDDQPPPPRLADRPE